VPVPQRKLLGPTSVAPRAESVGTEVYDTVMEVNVPTDDYRLKIFPTRAAVIDDSLTHYLSAYKLRRGVPPAVTKKLFGELRNAVETLPEPRSRGFTFMEIFDTVSDRKDQVPARRAVEDALRDLERNILEFRSVIEFRSFQVHEQTYTLLLEGPSAAARGDDEADRFWLRAHFKPAIVITSDRDPERAALPDEVRERGLGNEPDVKVLDMDPEVFELRLATLRLGAHFNPSGRENAAYWCRDALTSIARGIAVSVFGLEGDPAHRRGHGGDDWLFSEPLPQRLGPGDYAQICQVGTLSSDENFTSVTLGLAMTPEGAPQKLARLLPTFASKLALLALEVRVPWVADRDPCAYDPRVLDVNDDEEVWEDHQWKHHEWSERQHARLYARLCDRYRIHARETPDGDLAVLGPGMLLGMSVSAAGRWCYLSFISEHRDGRLFEIIRSFDTEGLLRELYEPFMDHVAIE
jgi:hypothetical protein